MARASSVRFFASDGVRIGPGDTALHRMPAAPYIVATYFVREFTAPFDEPYATSARSPARAELDEVLTIAPAPFSSMPGRRYLQVSMPARTLTAIERSHTSMSMSRIPVS